MCAKGPGFAGCGHCYINADEVETWTVEATFRRLDTAELAAALAEVNAEDPEAERWQEEVDQAQEQLDELARCGRRRRSPGRVDDCPRPDRGTPYRRPQADRESLPGDRARWVGREQRRTARGVGDLDMTRQHAIIGAVFDHVVVGPARRGYNRFDWSRLEPRWRL